MVTDWILDTLTSFWEWLCSVLPAPEVPEWWGTLTTAIDTVNSHITGLGAWLPFPVLRTVVAAVATLMLVSLGLKIARIVASFFTAGGGSAG